MTTTESVKWMQDGSGELEPTRHPAFDRAMTLRMSATLAFDLGHEVCAVAPEREWVLATHHGDAATLAGVINPAIGYLIQGPFDDEVYLKVVDAGLDAKAIMAALAALLAVGAALALTCGQEHRAETLGAAAIKMTHDESLATLAGSVVVDAALAEARPAITPGERVEAARAVRAHREHA